MKPGYIYILPLVFLACMLLHESPARAAAPFAGLGKGNRIDIRSDELDVEKTPDGKRTRAQGNVNVRLTDMQLWADAVTIDEPRGLVEAVGHVTMTGGGESVRGAYLRYSLIDKTLMVRDGSLRAPRNDLFVEAETLWKLGPQEFSFRGARLSTCTCSLPEPPAYIRATTMHVSLGEYATMALPVFYVESMPIFVLPWAMIPVKRERQTGLLFPHFGYNRREGLRIRPAAVIIFSRNTELLAEAEISTALGVGGSGNFRWVKQGYQGILTGSYMNEIFKTVYPSFSLASWRAPASSIAERATSGAVAVPGSRAQRWTLSTAQSMAFGRWGWLRLNSTLISDARYYEDYASNLADLTTDRVSSQFEFGTRSRSGGASLDASVYSSVRSVSNTDLQSFPRLRIGWSGDSPVLGIVPRLWMELENDVVKSLPSDFSLAPTAFTRQGLNGRSVASLLGHQEPVRGIRLYEELSLDGYYHASAISPDSGQSLRGTAVGGLSLYAGRAYGRGRNASVHIVELFSGLASSVGKVTGSGLIWDEEVEDSVLSARAGLRSRIQNEAFLLDLAAYQSRITSSTGALSWGDAQRAWHVEGKYQSQLFTMSAQWRSGDSRLVTADISSLLALPTGNLTFGGGYRYQDTAWSERSAIWTPEGSLQFSSQGESRLGHDVWASLSLPIWRQLVGYEEARYSVSRSELVYWRSALRIGSSCECWSVQAGYTQLPDPGTDRIEFAFEMVGLGKSSLTQ